jgi:hypothetical protein
MTELDLRFRLETVDPAVGGATYSVNGSAFQTSADFIMLQERIT